MVKCPECGEEAKGKFCKFCGHALPPTCGTCGGELTGGSCKKCGTGERRPSASPTPGVRKVSIVPDSLSALKTAEKIAWKKGRLLGKGSFGSVYLGMLSEGKLSAVKVVELGNAQSPQGSDIQQLTDEIRLMSAYEHENIVQYYGSCWNSDNNAIEVFMEYIAGGTLSSLYKYFEGFPETALRAYTRQMLSGLHYLHDHKIVHRDIKGDNILVSNDGTVKLADFGCSKSMDTLCSKTHGCKTMVGTPYWMAPEVISNDGGYGAKADVWSVGCTVIEMYTGKPPWPEFSSIWAAIYHIASDKNKPTIPEDLNEDAKSFLERCLERVVDTRATCEELLQHPFLIKTK